MSDIALSVLMVSYKTRDHLVRALELLFARPLPFEFEVIVVDNASGDGSVEAARARFPQVRFVENRYNHGFAVANNQAWALSRGRYVCPLNPDTEVAEGCFARLVEFLDSHPEAGMAVPLLATDAGLRVPLTSFTPIDPPASLRVLRRRLGATPEIPSAPKEVPWAWTTGFVVRRSALGEGPLFSEEMFLFVEEYGVCRRLRDRGYKIFLVPDAQLKHHASVTWNRNPEKLAVARRLGMAGLWSIHRKEHGGAIANLNQALIGLESAALWAGLAVEARVRGRRHIMLDDYRAQALASLGLLWRGRAYVDEINQRARRFFNDGKDPPPGPPR